MVFVLLVTSLASINGEEHGPLVFVVADSAPVSASQLAQNGVSVALNPLVEQLLQCSTVNIKDHHERVTRVYLVISVAQFKGLHVVVVQQQDEVVDLLVVHQILD